MLIHNGGAAMPKEINANDYFRSRRPNTDPMRIMYSRIANAMELHGGVTMNRLCQMPEKELKRIRGIGDKALAVVMEECRNYLSKEKHK
jgi:DNA-directed RNA polymerase alpha subunit